MTTCAGVSTDRLLVGYHVLAFSSSVNANSPMSLSLTKANSCYFDLRRSAKVFVVASNNLVCAFVKAYAFCAYVKAATSALPHQSQSTATAYRPVFAILVAPSHTYPFCVYEPTWTSTAHTSGG